MSEPATNPVDRARTAQAAWAGLPVRDRICRLDVLRKKIAARTGEILDTVCGEMGKTPMDALTGDVMVVLETLRFFQRHARRHLRTRKVARPAWLFAGVAFYEQQEPHGVVLVIAPWNYPFQLVMVPVITALVTGNAVIAKCSERTPATASLIRSLFAESGFSDDLVQIRTDAPENTEALLSARPDFIFFTGSSRAGQAVARRATELLVPVVLELGGKDACLVFDGCDLVRTVEGVCYGTFANAGQVCVGIKRIYVQRGMWPAFLEAFVDRARSLRGGMQPSADFGPIRFAFLRERLREQLDDALQRGAVLHSEWDRVSEVVPPLVLTGVPPDAAFLQDESFGPLVCLEPFETEDDAVRLANASAFALGASVFTADAEQGRRVAGRLLCGCCTINDVIRAVGNPYASFGGNRGSGYGRYHGVAGLQAFSRTKTIMQTSQRRKREIHWFPHKPSTYRALRMLLQVRHSGVLSLKRSWRLMTTFLFAICLLNPGFSGRAVLHAQDAPAPLTLAVQLPPQARGAVAFLVFRQAEGFPGSRERAVLHGFVPVQGAGGQQRITVGALPSGRYAVSIYLDVNNNRELDHGLLGIPKEPVGASNNPQGRMGPPHFEECAFEHGGEPQTIAITLVGRVK